MRWTVRPGILNGSITVPGDKSIGHRALMLSTLAAGTSTIRNLPSGDDVGSTARCLALLGASITQHDSITQIRSSGSLSAPETPLDAGNSGTTMRLLSGILAGQTFASEISGDDSLRRRPMDRVIHPLAQMGARITAEDGCAPLRIKGTRLHAIRYTLPVASAQVKSAILLAGLFAAGETTVIEPTPTRDHTERMLRGAGVSVQHEGTTISLCAGSLLPLDIDVPGDISSAAFFLVAAALANGVITVRAVGVNPTRTGLLGVLQRMGAAVSFTNELESGGEPVADLAVHGRAERAVRIDGAEVPLLVDELPLIALLATQARGTSTIRGAGELRHKETDRIVAVAELLGQLGASVRELPDGWEIDGPTPLRGAPVEARGDHRLAMLLAIAGTIAGGETVIHGAEAAAVSFPTFDRAFADLGGRIQCD